MRLPDYSDIEAAAERIAPYAVKTPVIENRALNERLGRRVLLKLEIFQHTGSFKFRGACNRLLQIPASDRARGVVAFSSGNHAQGVAAAARLLGMPALIVMPQDAPRPKIVGTQNLGAEIVFYDRHCDDREAIALKHCEGRGATLVRPFDDADIVAGQGTAGREMAFAAREKGLALKEVFVPCSGGGLTSGTALAFGSVSPGTRITAVEPADYAGMGLSLKADARTAAGAKQGSIADALMAPMPGAIPFAVAKSLACHGATVGDDDLRRAVSFCARVLKIVVEPSGSAGLAAILAGAGTAARGQAIGAIISGGNCEVAVVESCVARFPEP